jgi:hypothetical protein
VTTFDMIESCRKALQGLAPVPDCIYVTGGLYRQLIARMEEVPERWKAHLDFPFPVTMFNVPLVINDEMASVGGGSWAPAWRRWPS